MGATKRMLEEGESAEQEFKATHRHADGGLYQLVDWVNYNHDQAWVVIAKYVDKDGDVWYTSKKRWDKRFTALGTPGITHYIGDSRPGD